MSYYPEITSIDYEGYVDKVRVSYKYFVNDQDVWWYCFDDIVNFIQMSEKYAKSMYNKIPENDKMMVEDWNNYDKHGHQCMSLQRFITSNVVRQLIERNNKRNNILIKSMNILEFKEDAHDKYCDDEELLNIMNKTKKALDEKDYEEWAIQIFKSYNSDSFRDIADKIGLINKEIEYLKDSIGDEMYDMYEEFDEIFEIDSNFKLTKKEDDSYTVINVRHRKNIQSTCPDWLKDVVK